MSIRAIDESEYNIPMQGSPLLHENLAWFATEDDKVLGALIRDKVDYDYSWVVLKENPEGQGPGYYGVDMQASVATADEARKLLHAAMEKNR